MLITFLPVLCMGIEVCFFHIEKCCGSSLREMLFSYFKHWFDITEIYKADNEPNWTDQDQYKVMLYHCSYNQKGVTDRFSEHCFSITCVRNPIDRILSHYYFFDYPTTNTPFHVLDPSTKVEYIIAYGSLLLRRLSGETYDINDAVQHLRQINCILIMENMEKDLLLLIQTLNDTFGQKIDIPKIHTNANHCSVYNGETLDKDIAYINQYKDCIADLPLYEIITQMSDSERFKVKVL